MGFRWDNLKCGKQHAQKKKTGQDKCGTQQNMQNKKKKQDKITMGNELYWKSLFLDLPNNNVAFPTNCHYLHTFFFFWGFNKLFFLFFVIYITKLLIGKQNRKCSHHTQIIVGTYIYETYRYNDNRYIGTWYRGKE